jgi:hypothetical protein
MYQSWYPALAHRQQRITGFRGIMTRAKAVEGKAMIRDLRLPQPHRCKDASSGGLMALPVATCVSARVAAGRFPTRF